MGLWLRGSVLSQVAGALWASGAAGAQELILTNVTLIDGSGSAPRAGVTVVVRSGWITAVSDSVQPLPQGATVVDGRGRFLIPGLWDAHVHLGKAGASALPLFVANGVLSVRDMGGDFGAVQRMREAISRGAVVGPRIRTAGPILESPQRVERTARRRPSEPVRRTRVPVPDSASAERIVDSVARLGVDFIKFRTVASVSAYRGIAAAARRNGLALVGHGDAVAPDEMIRAGQRGIEHAILRPLQWRRARNRERIIAALAASRVTVVPTMVNYYEFFLVPRPRAEEILADSLGQLDPRRRYVSPELLAAWNEQLDDLAGDGRSVRRGVIRTVYRRVLRDYRAMHRAGVPLLPGTDVAVAFMYPGFSLHDELRYFVTEIGMTPMEALMSATSVPARAFGMQDTLGTIAVGMRADLVLLEADPLADITNTRRIAGVVQAGRWLDRAALDALLDGASQTDGRAVRRR